MKTVSKIACFGVGAGIGLVVGVAFSVWSFVNFEKNVTCALQNDEKDKDEKFSK